jgi:CheY-like chemotaxis protein
MGIKPEDMGKLFGKFEQVDIRKNRGIEGTGLGLAISRNLCRLMGGDITVESVYGKGSTFRAVIPQDVKNPAPLDMSVKAEAIAIDAEGAPSVKFTAPRARLLVVDDIATNLKVAAGLMAPYRATVETCLSGAEAVERIKQGEYDIIFMDHMMPELDGIETTAIIRALDDPHLRELPIIALTANAVSGMREMFLEKGFNDFLTKPIDVPKLNEIMEKWIPENKREMGNGGIGSEENAGGSPESLKAAISDPQSPKLSVGHSPTPHSLSLPGVDVSKGIAMTGGTVSGYKKVLEIFRRDAEERLGLLQNPPEEKDVPLFITQVHALKSASASIGAAELSALAERLEAAGKGALAGNAGDAALIGELLPGFAKQLAALAEEIRKVTTDHTDHTDGKDSTEKETANQDFVSSPAQAGSLRFVVNPLLSELAQALEAQKAAETDRILEKLLQMPLDKATKKLVEQISDDVLISEYGKALEKVKGFVSQRPSVIET